VRSGQETEVDNPREAMYRQRIQDMEAHISNLERLLRMMEVVNSTLDLPQLLDIIAEVAAQLTYTASASVLLIDEETKELRFVAVTGQHSAGLKPVVVPMDGSIIENVTSTYLMNYSFIYKVETIENVTVSAGTFTCYKCVMLNATTGDPFYTGDAGRRGSE